MPRLAVALDRALDGEHLAVTDPDDRRDLLLALRQLYAVHLGPLRTAADLRRSAAAARPEVAALKSDLEAAWVADLDHGRSLDPIVTADEAVARLRSAAADGRLPAVYGWLARSATADEVVRFLSLEGGPDADFDDLVADCQVGLRGAAKDELARNYWDEMGDGDHAGVHTVLHERMAQTLGITAVPDDQLPDEALARQALGGLLATNHHLQPEMVGALGLTELQAGPRCRMVLRALKRVGAPADSRPFYAVHAEVDPRHGRDWLDNAVVPLVRDQPAWGPGILRGARWRKELNDAFFAVAYDAMVEPAAA